MRRFKANAVAVTELADVNVLTVIVAENEDGSGACLEIQRALSFDEQDRVLGQDTYCLRTETGATYYGGVRSWSITPNVLQIRLDADAADALGVREGISVAIKPDHVLMLQEGLTRVVGLKAPAAE
jgi:hypothetical protein